MAAAASFLAAAAVVAAPFPASAAVNHPAFHPAAPAPARAQAVTWTVRPGQTLSGIAAAAYGSADLWPALWWVNKAQVPNPDLIRSGQVLHLSSWHPQAAWLYQAGKAADGPARVAVPVRPAAVSDGDVDGTRGTAPAARAVVPQAGAAVHAAAGSFQACVISRESGGNPRAVNASSGAGGLYQFLPSTWHALGYGGLPEDASVAVQDQAFARAYAMWGVSPWRPYDGC